VSVQNCSLDRVVSVQNCSLAIHADSRPAHEGESRTMSMHADEESDEGVVPMKRSNNEGHSSAKTVEGRTSFGPIALICFDERQSIALELAP
jgi:hypothetical protein